MAQNVTDKNIIQNIENQIDKTTRHGMLELVAPPPKRVSRGFFRDYVVNSRNVFGTISIFALIAFVVFSPGQIEIFDPIGKALSDFKFTDVVFSQFRADAEADTNIVIVNIGKLGRAQIAQQLQAISMFQPKVVALNATFAKERAPEVDSALIEALRSVPNMVLSANAEGTIDDDDEDLPICTGLATSHPKFLLPNVSIGNALLRGDKDDKSSRTVRTFFPQYILRDTVNKRKDTNVVHFAATIASRYNPVLGQRLLERGNDEEIINYKGNLKKFIVLDLDQMNADNLQIVKDKIVLMGYVGQPFDDPTSVEDKFYTPVAENYAGKSLPDMYGILIHANILSMMLQNDYIDQMPAWQGITMAILVCYFNIFLFHLISEKFPALAGGEMKVIQIMQATILTLLAFWSMYAWKYSIDFALSLAVVALVSDILEIHESSVQRLIEKLKESRR